jgi:hydrogenase-4 component B
MSVAEMPSDVLATLSWLAPALLPLAALPLLARARQRLYALLPLAALPAVAVALFATPGSVDLPWLFLGARFGLDESSRVFLLFTAALWLAGGLHAAGYLHDDPRRRAFWLFWLAAMAGNFGLVLALDAASFYVFFALMSFASYGLVVHARTPEALHAGRVYLALVVLGELALFAAIALAWHAAGSLQFDAIASALAGSPQRDAVIALTLVGFGIKVGALPLHVWLPLAHPVAPTPASAVLSGAMIKAGLLGWLRLLPLGSAAAPAWGETLIALGLAAAFAAALAGAVQRQAKAALAYSSISQMGFVTVAVGIALAVPAAAPAAVAAATLYAFHHAFAKAALFLGVSLAGAPTARARALWMIGVALPALALAGAPLTSGYAAKAALKTALPAGFESVAAALTLAAAGTSLVMLRVVWLMRQDAGAGAHASHAPNAAMWAGWALLVGCSLLGWAAAGRLADLWPATTGAWLGAVWPLLLGAALAALAVAWRRRSAGGRGFTVPPGDLLVPLLALARQGPPPVPAAHAGHGPEDEAQAVVPSWPALGRAEAALSTRGGLALAGIAAALAALLIGLAV